MLTAYFRPEAELTLFLRMRAKESPNHCYCPVIGNQGRRIEWQGHIFDGSF